MELATMFSKNQMVVWTWLVSRAIVSSLSGLSRMVDQKLKVKSLELKQIPARDAVTILGGPDNTVIGIHLTVGGDATGHLMLLHEPNIAFELIDMQNGQPSGTTTSLAEMERSILGEMGNVTGSFFLNTLADACGLDLAISTPTIMIDLAGAILDIVLSKIMQAQDEVLIVKSTFGAGDRQIEGTFVVIPTAEFIESVLTLPEV